MRIASDFCRSHHMEGLMAALSKQISVRKSTALRQQSGEAINPEV